MKQKDKSKKGRCASCKSQFNFTTDILGQPFACPNCGATGFAPGPGLGRSDYAFQVFVWTIGLIFCLFVTSVSGVNLFGPAFIGHTILMFYTGRARLQNIGEKPGYAFMMIVPLANLAIALGLCLVPENASRIKRAALGRIETIR